MCLSCKTRHSAAPLFFENIPHILPSPGKVIISRQFLETQLPLYSGHKQSIVQSASEAWLLLSQREPIIGTFPFLLLH